MTPSTPIIILYEDGDELVHTNESPFCDDPTCGCRQDSDLLEEYIFDPLNDGLLTVEEAVNLHKNTHV
jgi:hypothetical protein